MSSKELDKGKRSRSSPIHGVRKHKEENKVDDIPPNPILNGLITWLTEHEIPNNSAQIVVSHVQAFYSDTICPLFPQPVNLGITAKKSDIGRVHVWLSLLWPEPFSLDSLEQTQQANDLSSKFAKQELPTLPPYPINIRGGLANICSKYCRG